MIGAVRKDNKIVKLPHLNRVLLVFLTGFRVK
jgi:hypothetical protein